MTFLTSLKSFFNKNFKTKSSGNQRNRQFVRLGLPFLAFVLIGTAGLSVLIDSRLKSADKGREIKDTTKYKKEKKQFSLEDELKKMNETIDLDAWNNVPVPSPTKGGADRKKFDQISIDKKNK